MSAISEDQLRMLNDLAAALKGTTVEEFVKANLKIKTEEEQSSSKAAETDLASSTTPLVGIQALYALHADTTISKTLKANKSYFVPNGAKKFFVLNAMDYYLSNNFYARRGLPAMDPFLSRLYFAILDIIAVLRAQAHVNSINSADYRTLKDFLELYPAETLAIPGPLMPFYKAICCSHPENPNYQRLAPALPKGYPQLPTSATDPTPVGKTLQERFLDANHIDWHIAFPPYIAYMYHAAHRATSTVFTAGANDSSSAGNKTLTIGPHDTMKTPLDYLSAGKTDKRNFSLFVTSKDPNTNAVPNATTDFSPYLRHDIFGNSGEGNFANMDAAIRQGLTKIGIAEPIRVNPELIPQMKRGHDLVEVPEVETDFPFDTIEETLLLKDGYEWFARLSAHMSTYATFFPESGTLADCSLEGPRIAQHVANIIQPSTPIAAPTFHGDESKLLRFPLTLSTTVLESNRIVEMVSAYTCINIDAPNYFDYIPTLGKGTRIGNFWDIRPYYDNGTEDRAYVKIDTAISRQVISKPKDL